MNAAVKGTPCTLKSAGTNLHTYQDLIDRCYWEYLRVYKPAGTKLLGASPHSVPGESTLNGIPIPAQVDTLDEPIAQVQGYGSYLLIPEGEALDTGFQFSLPAGITTMQSNTRNHIYLLRIQKQPGSIATPINVCVRLPAQAKMQSAVPVGDFKMGNWCLDTKLLTDINIRIEFFSPASDSPSLPALP